MPIPVSVGQEVPEFGSDGCVAVAVGLAVLVGPAVAVEVAVAVDVEVAVAVAVLVGVAVELPVGVAVELPVGVGVDVVKVKESWQVLIISCAAGLLDGTFGATGCVLN